MYVSFSWLLLFGLSSSVFGITGKGQTLTLQSQLENRTLEAVMRVQKVLSEKLRDEDKQVTKLDLLKVIVLPPIYFHFQDYFMYYSNMRLTSSNFSILKANLDVLGHEMMPLVIFPWVEINGKIKIGKLDSMTQRSDFRLSQSNLRGKGVMSLTPDLLNVTWAYFYFHPNSTVLDVKDSEELTGPDITEVFNLTDLGDILAKKMQRDISHELTQIVSHKINETLKENRKTANLEALNEEISALGINDTENANSFIDSLLEVGSNLICTKYGDSIKIPDIQEWFSEKVKYFNFIIRFRGSFRAVEGSAVGTSTVSRVGDVVFGLDNETLLHFYGIFGFKQLNLNYNYYKAELWGWGPSGRMYTLITPISTLVHVNLNLSSKKITLEKFRISSVGDMEVRLTGLSRMFDWLVSRVTTWVISLFRGRILHQLESKYEQYARDVFATYNIEELLGDSVNEAFIV